MPSAHPTTILFADSHPVSLVSPPIPHMRIRTLLLIALLLAAGCDRDTAPAAVVRPVAAECRSRPEGSRWAGEYRESAVFGDSEDEEVGGIILAGIAATDSMVYVMESQAATLWLLRPDLSLVRRVGREGNGPGEWRPFGPTTHGGSMRWVHASTSGVRVFEGERIQEFSRDGRFRRVLVNGAVQAGISPMQSRLAFLGDTLLYSAGGYDVVLSLLQNGTIARADLVDGRSPWWVRMRVGDEERPVLQLGLVPVDRKAGVGPAQARPLWDTDGACVVASDGAEPLLVYAPLGGRQDTMRVPLPDRVDRPEDYVERMGGLLQPGMRLAQPSAATRVRDLVIDPDGHVWLKPVQPPDGVPGGMEVLRVPLGGGEAVLDTVPAFPRAFGPPGVFFAETYTPDDAILVVRYERSGG